MTATHSPIKKIAIVLLWLIPTLSFAQITVDTSITTEQLVQDVLINGTCAETSNFSSFTGTAVGINGIAAFDASGTNFPFSGGVVLTSGDVNTVPGPNTNTAGGGGWPGDADLEAFTGATATNDASWIQFDFVPLTEQLSFDFIMASEEYNQNFECTFSDAFAFILTDQTTGVSENLAVLPGTTTPIQVTNIRPEVVGQCGAVNEEFFGQYNFAPFNDANTSPTNMNGQTVELTATSTVVVGNTYTIKLVVADSQDTAFNMAVFIEAGSFNIGSTDLGENLLIASGNAPCEGDTVTLDATDPDATSYTWFFNDVLIAGETNPTLDVTVAGEYGVEVTLVDLEDCVVRDDIVVEFINGDAVNLGDDLDVCEGETETLSVGPFGGDTTYVWLLDGMEIAGETNPTLDITAAGNYTVQVTFPAGCTFSDDAMATIVPTPTVDLGEDLNSCFDDPVTLDGTPDNVDPAMATYQWFLDGFAIGGATNVTFDATEAGVYTVEVTLGDCTGSDSLTINQANPDGTSCIANDLCDDAQPVVCGDIITGSTEGATVNDDPGFCGTASGAPGVWFSFVGTGDFIQLNLCNSNYDTKLQVFEGPCDSLACVDGNDDSCGLQSEVDFLSEVGTEYFFYVFGFGASQGNFELVVDCGPPPPGCVDALPFCSQEGLIFENTSDGSVAQDGIDYECLFTQPNPSWFFLEIDEAGDLDLEIVQNTAFDADGNPIGNELDVDFIAWGPFTDPVDACDNLNPDTSVDCSYSAAAVETFTIPNAQPGEIYIVLITNFNGNTGFISLGQTGGDGGTNCDILCDFDIDLGADQILCDVPSYEIITTLTGDDITNPTFEWNTGDTTQNLTVTETGTYTVAVTIGSCTETKSVFVQIGQTADFDLGEDFATCFDTPVILDATPSNFDPELATFQWFQDGVELAETTPVLEVVEIGNYEVIVDFEDCISSDSIVISADSLSVSLQDGFQTCPNETQTLVATTEDTDITYQWLLNGDVISGATSSTLDINIPPGTLGDQNYQVEISKGICVGTANIVITLYDVDNCTITQGISPSNLDGLNDTLDLTFLADRTGIENLQIFNRHGRLVFEQSNYIDQWRGQTNEDVDLPTGTYFYVINFSGEDPEYGRQSTGWIYLNQE